MPVPGKTTCCARATSGHAAAAPPRRLMNSRRLIGSPKPFHRTRTLPHHWMGCVVHHSQIGGAMSESGRKRRIDTPEEFSACPLRSDRVRTFAPQRIDAVCHNRPRAFARLLPSPVRARISARSNSAKPPSTVSMRRPCGVVVSAHVSLSERKPALAFATASSTLSKSRVDLASRSSRVTMSKSPASALAHPIAKTPKSSREADAGCKASVRNHCSPPLGLSLHLRSRRTM